MKQKRSWSGKMLTAKTVGQELLGVAGYETTFGQIGGGLLRNLLRDYVAWFMARPKIRERVPEETSAHHARRPAIF